MPSPDSDLTLSPPHPVALSATRGRTLLIAAAILWSLNGVIVKSPPLQAIPLEDRGWLLACYRALFASIALLPLVKWQRVRWRPGLLVSAATFTAMNTLFVIGLTRTSAAAAAFLQYTSTVWVFLFGWFALKERVHRGNVVALLCTVAGIAFIVLSERDQQRADGNLIALGSGVAFAGVILSLRLAARRRLRLADTAEPFRQRRRAVADRAAAWQRTATAAMAADRSSGRRANGTALRPGRSRNRPRHRPRGRAVVAAGATLEPSLGLALLGRARRLVHCHWRRIDPGRIGDSVRYLAGAALDTSLLTKSPRRIEVVIAPRRHAGP